MDNVELNSLKKLEERSSDTLSERILFGQFLISKGYISYSTLNEAIILQEHEKYNIKIGQVLLKHFNVFKDEAELADIVEEYYDLRNSIIKERKRENERYTIAGLIEDVDFFLNQYSKNLDTNILDKAILVLESEREYRISRNKT